MSDRLNIAFLWHMHQPLYRDPLTGIYELPWVLFHATKDYYDMVAILDDFPDVSQTFNIVPSLIEQLNDYASGNVKCLTRELTKKDPSDLTGKDKSDILDRFFHANWHNMIKPLPRYWELLEKRGFTADNGEMESALRYYTDQDFMDLQLLYNLAWIDPQIIRDDEELKGLQEKGSNYDSDDKAMIVSKQTEIAASVLPKYRELAERGQIELTTSPYYHPILPLICDSDSAREALPDIELPTTRLIHPDDARAQIAKGIKLFEETFGHKPRGMWPSEGSVSMDIIPLLKEAGIEWFATDEEILCNSTGKSFHRDNYGNPTDSFLYRPYSLETAPKDGAEAGEIKVVFRDHLLSDLIGFEYSRMDADHAADDMIHKLLNIRKLVDNPSEHIVSIILDGENAWENYANDGRDFLYALYSKLNNHNELKCVTIGDFLDKSHSTERLPKIFAGSWISHNFRVWIGHSEHSAAWEQVSTARAALVDAESTARVDGLYEEKEDSFNAAWEALYAAEGSDWFWWYGDIHSSDNDALFDLLFRRHIKMIYKAISVQPPMSLEIPIISTERGLRPVEKPVKLITPVIDGEITSYFEWLSAGLILRAPGGEVSGAMHTDTRWTGLIDQITYGFDLKNLYLRFDYLEELRPYEDKWSVTINLLHPMPLKIVVHVEGERLTSEVLERDDNHKWITLGPLTEAVAKDVLEIAIPFDITRTSPGDELWTFIQIDAIERGNERWPVKGFTIIDLPTKDFGSDYWSV